MTTPTHHRHRLRTGLIALLPAVLAATLIAGCGGGGASSSDSDRPAASTTGGSAAKSSREMAEDYLRKIIDQLDTVLADYRAGKTDEAYELAHSLGEGYEGNTEQHVAKASPTVQRQLDPLIEATLPGAIKRNAPQQEVADLVQRAQALTTQALEAIEKAE
jgi:hypothetical protein